MNILYTFMLHIQAKNADKLLIKFFKSHMKYNDQIFAPKFAVKRAFACIVLLLNAIDRSLFVFLFKNIITLMNLTSSVLLII